MLARFVFLSFYLIAHASSRFWQNPTQEEGIGRRLQVPSGNKKPLRALRPSEVRPTEAKPRGFIDRFLSRIKKLFGRRPFFTDKKRSEVNESWMKNEDELKSIYQRLQELSAIDSLLRGRLVGKNAIQGLRQLKDRIVFLNQVKLLELGNIELTTSDLNLMKLLSTKDNHKSTMNPDVNTLPRDIVREISSRVWKNLGGSIVLELKNLIVDDSDLFFLRPKEFSDHNYAVVLWWKYALKIIDLLFVIDFVEKDTVRNFFRDPKIVEKFLHYTTLRQIRHKTKSIDPITSGSPQLIKQWYWPLWHDCFKALSNKEENLLRGHLLLESRYKQTVDRVDEHFQDNLEWKDFFHSRPFDRSHYLDQLRSSSKSLTSETQDMINSDVKRIIYLVTASCRDFNPSIPFILWIELRWLHDVLELIEECISPGIIEKTLVEDPNFKWYEMNRKIWKLVFQMDDLKWNADQYFKYVRRQSPNDWSTSSVYKSNLDAYLNELIQTLSEFKKESKRLREQLQNQPNQLTYLQSLFHKEVFFDKLVAELRERLAQFRL